MPVLPNKVGDRIREVALTALREHKSQNSPRSLDVLVPRVTGLWRQSSQILTPSKPSGSIFNLDAAIEKNKKPQKIKRHIVHEKLPLVNESGSRGPRTQHDKTLFELRLVHDAAGQSLPAPTKATSLFEGFRSMWSKAVEISPDSRQNDEERQDTPILKEAFKLPALCRRLSEHEVRLLHSYDEMLRKEEQQTARRKKVAPPSRVFFVNEAHHAFSQSRHRAKFKSWDLDQIDWSSVLPDDPLPSSFCAPSDVKSPRMKVQAAPSKKTRPKKRDPGVKAPEGKEVKRAIAAKVWKIQSRDSVDSCAKQVRFEVAKSASAIDLEKAAAPELQGSRETSVASEVQQTAIATKSWDSNKVVTSAESHPPCSLAQSCHGKRVRRVSAKKLGCLDLDECGKCKHVFVASQYD